LVGHGLQLSGRSPSPNCVVTNGRAIAITNGTTRIGV
jgi:hypothetical protein